MKVFVPLLAVLALFALAWLGTEVLGLTVVFGVVLPYAALVVFLVGFVLRVLGWARVPVPFRIPTTCGQQRTLPWIQPERLENPHTKLEVVGRMLLEVLLFRSLARNTATEVRPNGQVVHASSMWLWLASLAFHWCFLIILIRHLRFLVEPVPAWLVGFASLDGFLEIGVPTLLFSGAILFAAGLFLFVRRLWSPQLRYGSLAADYFPLFLIIGIAASGLLLRHVVRADVFSIKELAMGVVSFNWSLPDGIHWLFYAHLLLVCVLLMYFPFSKLMHMGGVFLSPTRNMASNNRAIRHINPWNPVVPAHSYAEYEDDFRDKMKTAGIPVEKE
jgi:nitrate reductase gamma subunit